MAEEVIGRAFVKIEPDTKGFAQDAERGVGGSLKKVAAIAGTAFAGIQVGGFLKGAIDEASALGESMSKNDIVFGKASKGVQDFAKTAASSLGLSRGAALEATGTFGNLLRAVGLNEDVSAKFSTTMVTLAGDLASFNNASPEEALDALRSGLVGETEPLKRFGVNLNEATLKAKAMELGLSDGKGVLDSNAKAQAAYAVIMEQTSLAQGDFARTSGGLANQQRILSARFADVKAKIGAALLPVVTKLVTALSNGLGPAMDGIRQVMDRIGPPIQEVVKAFQVLFGDEGAGGFAEVMDHLTGNSGKNIETFRKIGQAIRDVAEFVRDHAKPILIALGVAIGVLLSPVLVVVGALVLLYARFQGVRDVVGALVDFVVNDVGPAFADLAKSVAGQIDKMVAFVQMILPQVEEAFSHVVNFVLDLWRAFGDELGAVLRIAFDVVRRVVETALRVVRDVIQFVVALINGDWGKAWDAIKDIPLAVLGLLRGLIVDALRLVGQAIELGLSAIRLAWDKLWEGLGGVVGAVFDGIVGFVTNRINDLVRLLNFFIRAAVDSVNNLASLLDVLPGANPIKKIKAPQIGLIGGNGQGQQTLTSGQGTRDRRLQGLAGGGVVTRGGFFRVGERGPETAFLPSGSAVTPNGGGGVVVNLHVAGSVLTEGELVRTLREAILREVARNGPRGFD